MDSRLRFCSPSNTPTRHTLGQWWRKKKEAKKKRTVKTNKPTPGRSRNGRHRHTHTKRKGAATAGGPATVRRPADRADPRFEPTRGSSRPAVRADPRVGPNRRSLSGGRWPAPASAAQCTASSGRAIRVVWPPLYGLRASFVFLFFFFFFTPPPLGRPPPGALFVCVGREQDHAASALARESVRPLVVAVLRRKEEPSNRTTCDIVSFFFGGR